MLKIIFILSIIFAFTLFTVNCTSSSKSSNESGNSVSVSGDGEPTGYNGELQGTVISEKSPELSKTDNLEELLQNASLGNLSLEFPKLNGYEATKIKVPNEAMTELNSHFRSYIEFCWNKPKNAQEAVDKDAGLINKIEKVRSKLSKIEIDAPDGKRNISQLETQRLLSFVTKSALKICDLNSKNN